MRKGEVIVSSNTPTPCLSLNSASDSPLSVSPPRGGEGGDNCLHNFLDFAPMSAWIKYLRPHRPASWAGSRAGSPVS
jgi:hypothetical protein